MIDLAAQFLAHAVGDYVIQSDWMAQEKKDRALAAGLHAATYALPFLLATRSPAALLFIAGTHFAIDHWRLARYVGWTKNFIGSPWSWEAARAFLGWAFWRVLRRRAPIPDVVWSPYRRPWSECSTTGYPETRPAWLTVWLLIITDNLMHVGCNWLALRWL